MIRRILGNLSPYAGGKVISLKLVLGRKDWIAHHGMQRNGTNYLLMCLKKLGLDTINGTDPQRNDPRHKHYRWYPSKDSIPQFLLPLYGNKISANSIEQINRICSYPQSTPHIVIKKRPENAVVSIANWGIKCGWFKNKDEAISNLRIIQKDYNEYYKFWQEIELKSSNQVIVLEYESVMEDSSKLAESLKIIGIKNLPKKIDLKFDGVRQSPKNRKKIITTEDYFNNNINLST
ncbi:MAG: hypothetical protein AAGJ09_00140 [Pseudomonadota bacterium]